MPLKESRRGQWIVSGGSPIHIKVGGSPDNLSGIDRSGKVCWRFTIPFLRNVVSSPRFVAYSDHNAVLGLWTPASGGASTLAFLRRNWKIYVRAVQTGRLLWDRSIVDAGEPIALSDDTELWTIRLSNTKGYFLLGETPQYGLELWDAQTGHVKHAWRMPVLRLTAENNWGTTNQTAEDDTTGKDTKRFLDGRWQLLLTAINEHHSVTEMAFAGKEQTPSLILRYRRGRQRMECQIEEQSIPLHRIR